MPRRKLPHGRSYVRKQARHKCPRTKCPLQHPWRDLRNQCLHSRLRRPQHDRHPNLRGMGRPLNLHVPLPNSQHSTNRACRHKRRVMSHVRLGNPLVRLQRVYLRHDHPAQLQRRLGRHHHVELRRVSADAPTAGLPDGDAGPDLDE